TTCSVTFTPSEGENTVTATFADEANGAMSSSFEFVLTYDGTDGTDGADGTDGTDDTGNNGGNESNEDGSSSPDFTVSQPTVEIIAAADTPESRVEQVTMTIPVTNTTGSTVTLGAQSDVRQMPCAAPTLASGDSTTCSVTFTPS